ncbi:MAG: hypothetical protein E7640_03720 [Ruminococcaceae bacterium]|nr:hypothetical protein [Oscillospiraceae bacterium]
MSEGKYKKLLSNTAIYGIGTFASKILVFLLTRLYTECLSPTEYGTADLISNAANLLIPLAAAGVCDGIFRFALDANESNKKNVFSTGCTLLGISSAVFAVVMAIAFAFGVYSEYLWLVAAYVLMSNFHSACALYIRALDRTKLYALQGIMNTVLTISFNILFLVILPESSFFNGVNGYVLSVVIADAIMGAFLMLYARLYRDISPKAYDKSLSKQLIKYSLPLVPTTIFWWITNVSDRFMVTYFCGEAANGLYTVAYKIPTLIILITGVFSEAWQFSAVKESDERERSEFYTKVFSYFRSVIFATGAFVIAFSQIIALLLYAEEYYSAWTYIPVLVGSSMFSAFVTFLSSVYVVKKKSIKSFLTAMAGSIINIALNFVMIPESLTLFGVTVPLLGLGAQGAAIATAISYASVFLIRAVDTKKLLNFRLGASTLIINIIIICAQALIMLFVKNMIFLAAGQVLCVILILAVNAKAFIGGINGMISMTKGKKS